MYQIAEGEHKAMKQYAPKPTHYYTQFKEFLTDAAAQFGDKPAITTYARNGSASTKSYRELAQDAFTFAQALCANGLCGKHIALVGENSYEWLVAYFGTVACGSVAVCIDIEHSDDIIQQMIVQADTQAVVCSEALASLLEDVGAGQRLIVMHPQEESADSFAAFCESGTTPEATALFEAISPATEQTAAIVYTSGTTSTAKPVMLSHRAILSNAADSLTLLDSREKVFDSLPLYHTYGFTCGIMCALIRGLHVCITCDIKRMMQEMTLYKPGMLVAVPLIIEVLHGYVWSLIEKSGKKQKIQRLMKLEKVLNKPNSLLAAEMPAILKGTCLEKLDILLSGGAYLSLEVAQDLLHFGITVLQGYGITECSPSISCNRNEDFCLDSVGVILPGNQVKFEEDEILVKGYALMNGYYNAPELTAQAFTEDGWFRTGDLGYLDKRGHLHITGRKKNLIVMKNGKKVAAEEMENEIRQMPLVKDVMVYGALSGSSADDVKIAAAIYPDPELTSHMTTYEVLAHLQDSIDKLNAKLPTYKQVQMINIRETDFDRTASHKIKRQTV